MSTQKLGVIGGGNMAEAIVRGAIEAGALRARDVVVSDPSPERRELFALLGARSVDDNRDPAGLATVLLAVKPQKMADALAGLVDALADDARVISIAAGTPTSKLDGLLGGRGRIVRVMPNTPMLVGAGVSALCAGPRATDADLDAAEQLLGASGRCVRVSESQMDAVTAVSGSGPAYFFYLAEAMIAAGVAEGLEPETAAELAAATCHGAGRMLLETGEDAATLREKVTSPGGTTQRALETLDRQGAKDLLIAAVRAAAQRSRELAQ